MADVSKGKPAKTPSPQTRAARQADALKRNLKRRKAAQKQGDKA
ncbi:hypothetical protein U91I_03294 [alpha proteobacterium U9-1i]|nr:hypothetical protein U91I_03294 [alpha proteobacterium U9-1i]